MNTIKKNTPKSNISKSNEKEVIALVTEKVFKNTTSKSGNPVLKSALESRLYANYNVNGTTSIVLSALSTLNTPKKKAYNRIEFLEGIENLKKDRAKGKDSTYWLRLEKLYSTYGGRSSNPDKKINPVLSGLKSNLNKGIIKGFNLEEIGSDVQRKAFGFAI